MGNQPQSLWLSPDHYWLSCGLMGCGNEGLSSLHSTRESQEWCEHDDTASVSHQMANGTGCSPWPR